MAKKLSLAKILLQEWDIDSEYQDFLRRREKEIDAHDDVEIYRIYDKRTRKEVHWERDDVEAYWWMEDHGGEDKYYMRQDWITYREWLEDYGGDPI